MEDSAIESREETGPASAHLRVGLVAVGIALGYVTTVFLFGWDFICCLAGLLMLLSLLFGGIAVLCGLALKANRQRPRIWKHIAVFLVIISLLGMLTIGPGNFFNLLNLRSRIAVVVTGGHDKLQSWAMGLLSEADSHMRDKYDVWQVPRDRWSKQVRRLRPKAVRVYRYFENNQRGVGLLYGGGFLRYSIVVGPPGSRPDPPLNEPNSDDFRCRWTDGVYCWFQP